MPQQTSAGSELLTAIGSGDEAQFQRLYAATSGSAFSLAMRISGDPAVATEACEMAYANLWREAKDLTSSITDVEGWLLAEVRRCALAARKVNDDSSGAPSASYTGVAAPETGVLDSLEGLQRRALELAYFGGLTVDAIAEIVCEPVTVVRTALREGMLKLAAITRDAQESAP